MSALYFHIPFCKSRCVYCDFYSQTDKQKMNTYVEAMARELNLRKNYLPENEEITSIYFGGGTPSLLKPFHFKTIFENVFSNFSVAKNAEITLEANPDDLNDTFFENIAPLPFNRLSIGIQSFDEVNLQFLNRRHSATQAITAVENAKKYGFTNISIDLMYGLPHQTLEKWSWQISQALLLDIQHISAYGLTYEENTPLWKMWKNSEISPISDDIMNEMYFLLLKKMRENAFELYEISNFAKKGFHSQHNSGYWRGVSYLGIGAAAHSYNGKTRQWNVASRTKYCDFIGQNRSFFEMETLSENEKYNDYIMLSLRTAEGLNIDFVEKNFGKKYAKFCLENIKKHLDNNNISQHGQHFYLSDSGILISNQIIIDLMWV